MSTSTISSSSTESEIAELENSIIADNLKAISTTGVTQLTPNGNTELIAAHATFVQSVATRRASIPFGSETTAQPVKAGSPIVVLPPPHPTVPAPKNQRTPFEVALAENESKSKAAQTKPATVSGTPEPPATTPAPVVASGLPVSPAEPIVAGQS